MAETRINIEEVNRENAKIGTTLTVGIGGIVIVTILGAGLILFAVYKLLDKHGGEALKLAPFLL